MVWEEGDLALWYQVKAEEIIMTTLFNKSSLVHAPYIL